MSQIFAPPSVSLRQLQYLVAVADLGGFGKAAAACHVAQPSLSAQVAQAESQLNVQVFERGQRGVRVSTAGTAVLEQARVVLNAVRHLEELAAQLTDPFTGTIRLGVIPTVGPYLLPEIVPMLRAAYPKLTMQWTEERTPTLVRLLQDGQLDAAILALDDSVDGLAHAKLTFDPFVIAAAKDNPVNAGHKPVRLRELDGAEVLLLEDGHCLRDQALSLCDSAGAREGNFRATSLATLVQMVSSGKAVTVLPAMAVPVENRRGQLSVREFAPKSPGRTLVLAWRKGSALRLALDAVAATIREGLASTAKTSTRARS
ncbi:MAG: LysR substrate-binding domain-containing protein [Vicinamibacterales bacterium]